MLLIQLYPVNMIEIQRATHKILVMFLILHKPNGDSTGYTVTHIRKSGRLKGKEHIYKALLLFPSSPASSTGRADFFIPHPVVSRDSLTGKRPKLILNVILTQEDDPPSISCPVQHLRNAVSI